MAIKIDPEFYKAYYRRASAYLFLSKYTEALKDFYFLQKKMPEDKSLNEWKENHMNFFKKIDPNFNENTKVIFEVFEVIKKCK